MSMFVRSMIHDPDLLLKPNSQIPKFTYITYLLMALWRKSKD